MGSAAAVLHLRKSVSFTPAGRPSGSIDGPFGSYTRRRRSQSRSARRGRARHLLALGTARAGVVTPDGFQL